MNNKEVWLLGPPGTGKTTKLSSYIIEGINKVGADKVLVGSFTKAAAVELISRDLPISDNRIGTLHALCYRALGRPEIAEVKHIKEWNEYASEYALSSESGKLTLDDESSGDDEGTTDGDRLLQEYNTLRARCTPREQYDPAVDAFATKWDFWLNLYGYVDFTGLIEKGITHLEEVPGTPSIMYLDECQDFSALELQLVRKWEEQVDLCFMSFDDDQSIYHFKGASPEELIRNPAHKQQVLKQSYRVPRAILDHSLEWIQQVKIRAIKEYSPRLDDNGTEVVGSIRTIDASYKYIEPIVDDALEQVQKGKSVMILGTCGYMLEPLKAVLRKNGIPFHNPYKIKRGDWNPLRSASEGALTVSMKLAAYLKPFINEMWTFGDVAAWIEDLNTKDMLRWGSKTTLKSGEITTQDELESMFTDDNFEEALVNAVNGNIEWFEKRIIASRVRTFEFPIEVYKQRGLNALLTKPKICIGTIHSVKGGEADVVYVFPDLSIAGMQEWCGDDTGKDAIVRLFYVAMTRAREELVFCNPAQKYFVSLQ
jgi:DNA helicase-2/ATP-dependent DNA helicase PcrA